MKPIISEPPDAGASQSTRTVSLLNVVVGAAGYSGTYAANISTSYDIGLNPNLVLDCTLNLYTVPGVKLIA